ncbi:hypothetical protein VNPA141826_01960 [Pseudomonas aeruginosa]|nr:hypothetical protein VNPA141826_01960 [Pseudomonas aeruginosa]
MVTAGSWGVALNGWRPMRGARIRVEAEVAAGLPYTSMLVHTSISKGRAKSAAAPRETPPTDPAVENQPIDSNDLFLKEEVAMILGGERGKRPWALPRQKLPHPSGAFGNTSQRKCG